MAAPSDHDPNFPGLLSPRTYLEQIVTDCGYSQITAPWQQLTNNQGSHWRLLRGYAERRAAHTQRYCRGAAITTDSALLAWLAQPVEEAGEHSRYYYLNYLAKDYATNNAAAYLYILDQLKLSPAQGDRCIAACNIFDYNRRRDHGRARAIRRHNDPPAVPRFRLDNIDEWVPYKRNPDGSVAGDSYADSERRAAAAELAREDAALAALLPPTVELLPDSPPDLPQDAAAEAIAVARARLATLDDDWEDDPPDDEPVTADEDEGLRPESPNV